MGSNPTLSAIPMDFGWFLPNSKHGRTSRQGFRGEEMARPSITPPSGALVEEPFGRANISGTRNARS